MRHNALDIRARRPTLRKMTPESLRQRAAYLGLGDDEIARLRALKPLLEERANEFVAAFYRHLLSFAPTRLLLRDPAVKERLLEKQKQYLLSLAEPEFDEDYAERRREIGRVHHRVGLEPAWFLGGYSLYFSLLVPHICDAYHEDPVEASRVVVALQKQLGFDSTLAMETYIDRSHEELRFQSEELAKEGRQLARDYRDQGEVLQQTTERARAAEELASIATLVAGLAHEIGTPMGVIQGHAKMLESAVSSEDASWRLKTIQQQISRISRIIQTLLNMARPRRAQRAPVELEPLLDATFSFVAEKLKRRGIEVKRDLAPVPSISGDSERLQQLFLNLLLNAADAMPEGGELHLTLAESEDGEACVCIADSGTGIPAGDLERVFDPFFTTKAAGQGNGLGLMVCKGIVTDHGGSIEVRSAEGAGTEFYVHLPIPGREAAANRA